MKKYEIVNNEGIYAIYSSEESAFFAGYDFMGSINWVKIPDVSCWMGREEAEQIVSDLESADEPAEYPVKDQKQYIMRTWIAGDLGVDVVTAKELAHCYEMNEECGIYGKMEAWDPETMQQINLLELVQPIIDQEHWIEEEYRSCCENEY